ncbi:phosphoprotein phosphatase [Dorcoceras hygrometricum]|uniref:Phosphoprotein phosphatase n=1 Tax=Dorcoceras hygrometricum TaxID=472368 RepID=A0A2Z7D4W4_9LAMI|nr:phosphoprotein phosphatase [Dorcoceras hygrometricum]
MTSSQSAVSYSDQQLSKSYQQMVRVQQMKKAAGALSIYDVISSDITISRKLLLTSRWLQWNRSSSWYLDLAIEKRCRLHKLIRQRFTFVLKIQQMLFALISSSRKIPAGSYSISRRELQRYIQPVVGKSSRKLFMTNDWTISCKHIVTTSWTSRRKQFSSSRELQWIQSKATVLCISSRQRIQQKRKAVVDMNQQRSS